MSQFHEPLLVKIEMNRTSIWSTNEFIDIESYLPLFCYEAFYCIPPEFYPAHNVFIGSKFDRRYIRS